MDDATRQAYREAWENWLNQLEQVHRVFLEGEKLSPDRMKGLLNREARAKERYDAARARLLGLDASPLAGTPANPDENPFR